MLPLTPFVTGDRTFQGDGIEVHGLAQFFPELNFSSTPSPLSMGNKCFKVI